MIFGLICGLVNGFLGSGGGILAVQLCESSGFESKRAHATAMLTILPLSLISTAVYFSKGAIDLGANTIALMAGGAAGGFAGAVLLKKMPEKAIDAVFSGLIIISGIWMLL